MGLGLATPPGLSGFAGSRNRFEQSLFPLTKKELPHYRFALEGEEAFRGRKVYRAALLFRLLNRASERLRQLPCAPR